MSATMRRVDYYYVTVQDRPGEGYRLLAGLAAGGVNLLAFTAVPVGPNLVQLTLFPEDSKLLTQVAHDKGWNLLGPQQAFLIQGDDELGAFGGIHRLLADGGVNVFASTGVTDNRGGYGYLLYVKPEDVAAAASILGV